MGFPSPKKMLDVSKKGAQRQEKPSIRPQVLYIKNFTNDLTITDCEPLTKHFVNSLKFCLVPAIFLSFA